MAPERGWLFAPHVTAITCSGLRRCGLGRRLVVHSRLSSCSGSPIAARAKVRKLTGRSGRRSRSRSVGFHAAGAGDYISRSLADPCLTSRVSLVHHMDGCVRRSLATDCSSFTKSRLAVVHSFDRIRAGTTWQHYVGSVRLSGIAWFSSMKMEANTGVEVCAQTQ